MNKLNQQFLLILSLLLLIGFLLLTPLVVPYQQAVPPVWAIFISMWLFFLKWLGDRQVHLKNQLNILKSVLTKIKFIEKDSNGFLTELKDKLYCPYDVKQIDVDRFVLVFDYSISEKKFKDLVDMLYFLEDKIKLINNYNKTIKDVIYYTGEHPNDIKKEAIGVISIIVYKREIIRIINEEFSKEKDKTINLLDHLIKQLDYILYI